MAPPPVHSATTDWHLDCFGIWGVTNSSAMGIHTHAPPVHTHIDFCWLLTKTLSLTNLSSGSFAIFSTRLESGHPPVFCLAGQAFARILLISLVSIPPPFISNQGSHAPPLRPTSVAWLERESWELSLPLVSPPTPMSPASHSPATDPSRSWLSINPRLPLLHWRLSPIPVPYCNSLTVFLTFLACVM